MKQVVNAIFREYTCKQLHRSITYGKRKKDENIKKEETKMCH